MPEISTAISLLVTGMLTVFVVLLLVVVTGNILIRLVNKLPETDESGKGLVTEKQREIIGKAIDEMTSGRGVVTKIEKI